MLTAALEGNPKDRILKATFETIANKGIADTRTKDILKNAKISPGLLHYYFRSKNELYSQLLDWMLGQFEEGCKEFVSNTGDPLEKLSAFVHYHIYLMEEEPDILKVFYNFWVQGLSDKSIRDKIRELFTVYRDLVAKCIEEGISQGIFQDQKPHLLSLIVSSLFEGASVQFLIHKEALPIGEYFVIVRHIINTLAQDKGQVLKKALMTKRKYDRDKRIL